MPNPNRPKVGPADPDVRSRLLREELDKPTRAEGVAPKAEKPKGTRQRGKVRRVGVDGKTLDEVVSNAVDGAPKRPIR